MYIEVQKFSVIRGGPWVTCPLCPDLIFRSASPFAVQLFWTPELPKERKAFYQVSFREAKMLPCPPSPRPKAPSKIHLIFHWPNWVTCSSPNQSPVRELSCTDPFGNKH